ncbi:transcription factor 24-like [Ascaphus truei]|uniref:transcription factor 24-like n=1 Tax=Ascaphus truei TaxID=8439 RepID=UPI003F5A7D2F
MEEDEASLVTNCESGRSMESTVMVDGVHGDDLHGWPICASLPVTPTEERRKRTNPGKSHQLSGWKTKRQKVNKSALSCPGHFKTSQVKQCPENAARERSRVRTLRQAFLSLQAALPSVPPDTKLSKLDVLVLATSYIAHLTQTLDQDGPESTQIIRGPGYLHPMKKWPMRSRLYAGVQGADVSSAYAADKV